MNREDVQQYDKVSAVISPRRTDDLRPEAVPMIGNRYTFQALWRVDEGLPYEGDWYMRIVEQGYDESLVPDNIIWIPLCDLTDLELIDRIERSEP